MISIKSLIDEVNSSEVTNILSMYKTLYEKYDNIMSKNVGTYRTYNRILKYLLKDNIDNENIHIPLKSIDGNVLARTGTYQTDIVLKNDKTQFPIFSTPPLFINIVNPPTQSGVYKDIKCLSFMDIITRDECYPYLTNILNQDGIDIFNALADELNKLPAQKIQRNFKYNISLDDDERKYFNFSTKNASLILSLIYNNIYGMIYNNIYGMVVNSKYDTTIQRPTFRNGIFRNAIIRHKDYNYITETEERLFINNHSKEFTAALTDCHKQLTDKLVPYNNFLEFSNTIIKKYAVFDKI